jgi:hypothetical protein
MRSTNNLWKSLKGKRYSYGPPRMVNLTLIYVRHSSRWSEMTMTTKISATRTLKLFCSRSELTNFASGRAHVSDLQTDFLRSPTTTTLLLTQFGGAVSPALALGHLESEMISTKAY